MQQFNASGWALCKEFDDVIVSYPEDALECFLRTQMDVLVLGNFWIERSASISTPAL